MLVVVCGVLYDRDTRLVTVGKRRHDDPSYPGCWEFPGGKVEPGESHEMALRREWKEELDVDCVVIGARICTLYLRRAKSGDPFEIHAYFVQSCLPAPRAIEHSALRQVNAGYLARTSLFESVTPSTMPITYCMLNLLGQDNLHVPGER